MAKLLFLSANPPSTPRLGLDEEVRAIEANLHMSPAQHRIEFIPKLAVRPGDLLPLLNEHKPDIVHFSGHFHSSGSMILAGDDSGPLPVDKTALSELFCLFKQNLRLLVFNACDSRIQAELMTSSIGCVIAMSAPFSDQAARHFAASFYGALAFGLSVKDAFEQSTISLGLRGISEQHIPVLMGSRDARKIVFSPDSIRKPDASKTSVKHYLARKSDLMEATLRLLTSEECFALENRDLSSILQPIASWEPRCADALALEVISACPQRFRLSLLGELFPLLELSRLQSASPGDLALGPILAAGQLDVRVRDLLEWQPISMSGDVPIFEILRYPVTESIVSRLGLDRNAATGDSDALPATRMNYAECSAIALLLGGCLPTVAELTLAGWHTRSGHTRRYPWGDMPDPNRSNCRESALMKPCSVTEHAGLGTSDWGVEDLAGNVWEWTRTPDEFQLERLLVVGGSYAEYQHASSMGMVTSHSPEARLNNIGFRVVREWNEHAAAGRRIGDNRD
ncbi:MAG: SUMF1/EgtB/PvdO family nonheme iron enzyme [Proteobacteria bacterium]|nr:SUMF1/EgtB/PvdO family nonheme iron enzyme [Pseudomonadota bacterium]